MLNTKLILVDGMSGSGKSTIAHFIARQLEKNGIKAKWFYEQDKNHPLTCNKNDDESDQEFNTRYLKSAPQIWRDLVNTIINDDTIYIVESYLFQDMLLSFLEIDTDKQIIINFHNQIMEIIAELNPVVINFYQQNVEMAVRNNWQRRGDIWKEDIMKYWCKFSFCKNRNYSGEDGFIKLMQEFTDISLELFNNLNFRKLLIENSSHDWGTYRKQILNFLEISHYEEDHNGESLEKYCGLFAGNWFWFTFYKAENRLYSNSFWNNQKLIPIGQDEFQMEGFPISFKFKEDENKQFTSFIFTEAKCYYKEGDINTKITPLELRERELQKFCGEFRCESANLDRKIYLKDGNLFYWRNEESESMLLPVSQNKLAMYGASAMLEYKFANGVKQIIFTAQGDEDLVFVPIV